MSTDLKTQVGGAPVMFSVVIPTRNQPDSLQSSLMATLSQVDDDFEVIVVDNASGPETAEVVESFGSDKIRYVRSDAVLSISESWEMGVDHAQGAYVTVLRDSDALMPDACRIARVMVDDGAVEVLSWKPHRYWWPDAVPKAHQNHLLVLCAAIRQFSHDIPCAGLLSGLYRLKFPYQDVPAISSSFVARRVIEAVKAKAGRYFGGLSPDFYSGIANCWAAEKITFVQRPLSMQSTTQQSLDAAYLYPDVGGEALRQQYVAENAPEAVRCDHPLLGTLSSGSPVLRFLSALVFAREDLFADDFRYRVNALGTVEMVLNEAAQSATLYDEYLAVAERLAQYSGMKLQDFSLPARPAPQVGHGALPIGPEISDDGQIQYLGVDAGKLAVSDVFGAVRLAQGCMTII